MATDVERLIIRLEASASKFERDMDKARGVAAKATRQIEQDFARVNPAVSRSMAGLGAALAGALSVNEIRKAGDTYVKVMNNLKVAGLSGTQLAGVFDQLFQSAQRNAVPIEALSELYGRLSQAQTTLKTNSAELLGLTEIVAQSLRVSGKSASESSGALLQLAQALSGGKVQAEEYNSLLDGMYPLLQAAAAGIKEAGGDVAQLTKLVKDGEVSSALFFRAIQIGAPVIREKLADAALTTEQAMTKLNNEFVRAVGEFDRAVNVSGALAGGLDTVAASLGGIAREAANATNFVLGLVNALSRATQGAMNMASTGLLADGQSSLRGNDAAAIADLDRRIAAGGPAGRIASMKATRDALLRKQSGDTEGARFAELDREMVRGQAFTRLTSDPVQGPNRPAGAGINPNDRLSVKDPRFKAPGDDDKKSGGAAERANEYEREVQALQKKTELLKAEADAIGLGTIEVEKSKPIRELELAAKKAGVELTPQVQESIRQEAEAYAAAKKAVEDKNRALEQSRQLQEFIGSNLSSFFSDIVSGGKNASEAMMNLTKRLADTALQALLLGQGPLAGILGTGGGAKGAVGGIVGALFGGFRADGGPVSPGKAYVVGEKQPELFVPRTPGMIVPKVPGGGSGGGIAIHQSMVFQGQQDPAMLYQFGQKIKAETLAAVSSQRATRPNYLQQGI